MFLGISLAALKDAVVSLVEHLGKLILTVLAFIAIAVLLSSILPGDPFLTYIASVRETMAPYTAWINYFVPVRFIGSVTLIFAAWKYVSYLYRKLGGIMVDSNGQTFFDV